VSAVDGFFLVFVLFLVVYQFTLHRQAYKRQYQEDLERYKNVVATYDWRTVGELPEDEQRLAVAAIRRAEMKDPAYVEKWSRENME
jgi:hypothetical protein